MMFTKVQQLQICFFIYYLLTSYIPYLAIKSLFRYFGLTWDPKPITKHSGSAKWSGKLASLSLIGEDGLVPVAWTLISSDNNREHEILISEGGFSQLALLQENQQLFFIENLPLDRNHTPFSYAKEMRYSLNEDKTQLFKKGTESLNWSEIENVLLTKEKTRKVSSQRRYYVDVIWEKAGTSIVVAGQVLQKSMGSLDIYTPEKQKLNVTATIKSDSEIAGAGYASGIILVSKRWYQIETFFRAFLSFLFWVLCVLGGHNLYLFLTDRIQRGF